MHVTDIEVEMQLKEQEVAFLRQAMEELTQEREAENRELMANSGKHIGIYIQGNSDVRFSNYTVFHGNTAERGGGSCAGISFVMSSTTTRARGNAIA